jgi:hypothetical protein
MAKRAGTATSHLKPDKNMPNLNQKDTPAQGCAGTVPGALNTTQSL